MEINSAFCPHRHRLEPPQWWPSWKPPHFKRLIATARTIIFPCPLSYLNRKFGPAMCKIKISNCNITKSNHADVDNIFSSPWSQFHDHGNFFFCGRFPRLHQPQHHSPSPAPLTVRGGRRKRGWCSLTVGVVDGPDLDGGHVGKDADELLGLQSGGPLVLGVLMKSEGELLRSDTRHGVALGKDVRGDPLARALNNYVHHGRTSCLLPDLEFKGQELVVAEPLVPKVTFCSEKKTKLRVNLTASSFQMMLLISFI